MTTKDKISTILMPVLVSLFCFGCYSVHHGYKFENQTEAKETLQMMVERSAKIDDIVKKFGSPTFINSPINDVLCYASSDGTKVMFNRFYNPRYLIMCISFKNGVATKLEAKKMEQIKKEKFVTYNIKFDKHSYSNINEKN